MAADPTQSLGEYLRQERDKLGITLEQVASATKIGIKTLQALEADHYADLPAKPFIRGFVISYARFIGLDAKEVLSQFSRFIDDKYLERPNRESEYSGYAFEKREGEQSRTLLWLVMGGFIVFGGVVILFLKPSLHHHHMGHIEKLQEVEASASPVSATSPLPSPSAFASVSAAASPTITPSASPVSSPSSAPAPAHSTPIAVASPAPTKPLVLAPPSQAKPSAKPSSSPTPSPSPSASPSENLDPLNSGKNYAPGAIKYKLVFKALDNVAIRYKVDQKPAMRFALKKDKILVLRAQSTIIFQTADPKLISIKGNGQQEQLVSDAEPKTTPEGFATLYYPKQLADTIKNPFEGESFQR
jgi:cytoskeleton protein RodZ